MVKDAPAPIRTTFWKYTLLYFAIATIGIIISFSIRDEEILFLTIAIVVLGAWRTTQLYQIIRHTKYRTVEGVVVSDTKRPLSKGRTLIIQLEDGSQVSEIISGSRQLTVAKAYRIYLHSSVGPDVISALPEALKPVQILLGYEIVD